MLRLTYEGGWVDSSARHPESFTALAPPSLNRACGWNPLWPVPLWDTTIYGYPRFRLVLLSSRYQISGGLEIHFHDKSGNLQTIRPAEVFLPRYHVRPSFWGTYALEMWRPAYWYFTHGFASPAQAMEYTPAGSGVRSLEPVWEAGGWEAIWNGMESPMVFTRDVSTDLIEWSIWVLHLKFMQQIEAMKPIQPKKPTRMERYRENHGRIKDLILGNIKDRQREYTGLTLNVPGEIN